MNKAELAKIPLDLKVFHNPFTALYLLLHRIFKSVEKLDMRIAVYELYYRDHQRSEWVGPGGTKVVLDSKFAE